MIRVKASRILRSALLEKQFTQQLWLRLSPCILRIDFFRGIRTQHRIGETQKSSDIIQKGTISQHSRSTEEVEMMNLMKKKDFKGAISLLSKLRSRGEATLIAYNIALSAHASLRQAEGALETFKALQNDIKEGADLYSYGSLCSALCRAQRIDEAVSLLNLIVHANLKPNIVIMNTILHGAVSSNRFDLGSWISAVIHEEKMEINEMTLIGMVRLAALNRNSADVTKAWLEYVHKLAESNHPCSRAPLAALAVAYSKCRRPDLALRPMEKLICSSKNGSNLLPPKELLDAVESLWTSKSGEKEKAVTSRIETKDSSQLDQNLEATSRNVVPETRKQSKVGANGHTVTLDEHLCAAFESTANAFSRVGKDEYVREVLDMLKQVPDLPFTPGIVIAQIKSLIMKEAAALPRISNRSNSPDLILRPQEFTGSDNLQPAPEIYNALLREQVRRGGLQLARIQWRWMLSQRPLFRPDVYSFGTMLKAHATDSDVDGAWSTWTDMEAAGVSPDEACLVSLISAHARSRRTGSADSRVLQVEDEMTRLGKDHTIATATAMVRVLGQLGLEQDAFALMLTLQDNGIRIETRSWNALLNVVNDCQMGVPAAFGVLRDMRLAGCAPDRYSYNALISACVLPKWAGAPALVGQAERESLGPKLACFFLAYMEAAGVEAQTDTFNACLCCAIYSSRLTTARDLMVEMKLRRLSCNEITVYSILRAGRWNSSRHSQQELNWLLEQSIELGARPPEKDMVHLIQAAKDTSDVAQAIWYLGICIKHQLIESNRALDIIKDLDTQLRWMTEDPSFNDSMVNGGSNPKRTADIPVAYLRETLLRFKALLVISRP